MTKREIAALACKILAIYAFILSLHPLNSIMWRFMTAVSPGVNSSAPPVPTLSAFIPVIVSSMTAAIYLLCAGYLWLSADWIAGRMVKKREEDSAAHAPDLFPSGLKRLTFSAVGALALVQAIPQFVAGLADYFLSNTSNNPFRSPLFTVVEPAIESLLGIWLFCGAPTILQMLTAPARWGQTQSHHIVEDENE